MRILLTGASGAVGAALLPALTAAGHELRGFGRNPASVPATLPFVLGDAITGAGLDEALDGIDVAYFLIHSMEGDSRAGFEANERAAAENFVAAAQQAGVRRVVYLGGLVPQDRRPSRHLASRLEVEEILLAGSPEAIALRASIVIGASSRSFRFMVHLVERMKVLTLPAWREHRTQPIDARDVQAFLAGGGDDAARARRVVTRYRRSRRAQLRRDDPAHRRPHARAPPNAYVRAQRDADRRARRRRDRR